MLESKNEIPGSEILNIFMTCANKSLSSGVECIYIAMTKVKEPSSHSSQWH